MIFYSKNTTLTDTKGKSSHRYNKNQVLKFSVTLDKAIREDEPTNYKKNWTCESSDPDTLTY